MGAKPRKKPQPVQVAPEDADLISLIVHRAAEMQDAAGIACDRYSLSVDLLTVHRNGCPLQLAELLAAPDVHFGHDVFGIRKFLNRRTGRLRDTFRPRFAAPSKEG